MSCVLYFFREKDLQGGWMAKKRDSLSIVLYDPKLLRYDEVKAEAAPISLG